MSAVPLETEVDCEGAEESYAESYENSAENYEESSMENYEESYSESMEEVSDETVEEAEVGDSSTTEFESSTSSGTDPASSDLNAMFITVFVTVSGNSLTVSGSVSALNDDFSDLTLSFGGVFSGLTATIDSNGIFSASTSTTGSGGLGTIDLLQSGVSVEQQTLFV